MREVVPGPRFSAELEVTLHRALIYANQRKHRYSTLEHLLLALMDDADASAVMRVSADLGAMKENLVSYLDNQLGGLVIDNGGDSTPTAAFQRVVQRAVNYAQVLGHPMVTGANTLVAIFPETQSPAARLLGEHGVPPPDAAN
jgi:ATP-dependent Clp protease ATP-binding subunit ClpA